MTTRIRRSARERIQQFAPGSIATVRLGAARHSATVLEYRNGRVFVAVRINGADEPITTSYLPEELEPAS